MRPSKSVNALCLTYCESKATGCMFNSRNQFPIFQRRSQNTSLMTWLVRFYVWYSSKKKSGSAKLSLVIPSGVSVSNYPQKTTAPCCPLCRLLNPWPWNTEGVRVNVELSYHGGPSCLFCFATVWSSAMVPHWRGCPKCEYVWRNGKGVQISHIKHFFSLTK